jgi:uncharacterized protein
VSDKLPSRERALQLLNENGCSQKVVNHCLAVEKLALETAQALRKKGHNVDLELVDIGALLHDIGRSRTHTVNHVIEGIKIAETAGLPKSVISIIKCHVGGGITPNEAKALGWPTGESYVPLTLEEKVVSFADKLIEVSKRVSVELTINQLLNDGKPEAAERVRRLHDEMKALIGDCP